ncbi:hypothetical protein XA68_14247 [Ophiocordyceps unilateralis]|uniref:Uncharacterized protein n=1 Tax=Ophiocordyceps unilateralis TaxID=268505 RepID=A0A2A9PAV0_OPHUN|nr:hypothetical protein XA68_14247 [Ophiocordyceps unilateralis]
MPALSLLPLRHWGLQASCRAQVSSQEVAQVKPSAFTYDVNASRIVQARTSSAPSPICLPMTGLHDGLGLGETQMSSGRRVGEGSRGSATGAEAEGGGGAGVGGGTGGGGGSPTSAYSNKQYYAATGWANTGNGTGTGTGAGAGGAGGGVYGEDVTVDYAICSPSFATVTDEASPYRLASHAATTTAARASGLMYLDAETTYGYGTVRPPTVADTGCLPYHHHQSLAGAVTRPDRLPGTTGRTGATTPYRTTDYRRSGDAPSGLNGGGYHGYASAAHLAFGGPETAGYALSEAAFGGPGAMTASTAATSAEGDHHHGQSFLFRPHDGCGTLAGEANKGPGDEAKTSARMRS